MALAAYVSTTLCCVYKQASESHGLGSYRKFTVAGGAATPTPNRILWKNVRQKYCKGLTAPAATMTYLKRERKFSLQWLNITRDWQKKMVASNVFFATSSHSYTIIEWRVCPVIQNKH